MSTTPSSTEHWSDYIEISRSFPQQQREELEKACEMIANAHDGEGMALLRAAAARNNGYVELLPGAGATVYSPDAETIIVGFGQLEKFVYTNDDGQESSPSLTGVLVHELYHAADPHFGKSSELAGLVKDGVRATAEAHGVPWSESVNRDLDWIYGGQTFDGMVRDLAMSDRDLMSKNLRESNAFALATLLERLPADAFEKTFRERGLFEENGYSKIENDATRFTNAFMRKNFGCTEAQRVSYGHAKLNDESHAIPTPIPTPVPFETAGFEAAKLSSKTENPDEKAPHVSPVIHALGKTDFSALRGCSTDGQHYHGGDTGQFARVTAPVEKTNDGVARQ